MINIQNYFAGKSAGVNCRMAIFLINLSLLELTYITYSPATRTALSVGRLLLLESSNSFLIKQSAITMCNAF